MALRIPLLPALQTRSTLSTITLAALMALASASCSSSRSAGAVGGESVTPRDPSASADTMLPMPMAMPMPRPLNDDGIFFVETDDPTRPRIRYLDGQVSQNSSCAIRLDNKLNRKIPPVYINGQPIGFC
jgi:hypothetical protein